jgi:hypothetical protein
MRNITIDNTNKKVINYDNSWFFGSYNATNVSPSHSGTLASTDALSATLNFTFPRTCRANINIQMVPYCSCDEELAYAFYYFGMRRSQGGLYGICVDCFPPPNVRQPVTWMTIDAVNSTDDGRNLPVSTTDPLKPCD